MTLNTRKMKKKIFVWSFSLILVLASLGVGYIVGQNSVVCDICAPEDLNFSLFWEAYHTLKENFVEPEKINDQNVIYGAISGMVKSLGDPYTVFMTPDNTKKFMEDISGRFEGIGVEIGIRNEVLQVIAPIEGTPGQKAGLRPKDKIIKVNGQLTSEMTLDEAVSQIRGPKDTKVTLTIFRDGWDNIRDIEITREVIEVPSLKWELIEGNIGYVKIYQFSEKAAFDFTTAAIQILASGADRIILDVRNNPGGYLEVARDISGFFLKRGDLVVIEDSGKNQIEYKARGNSLFLNYPVVVLINEGSASGSEILAGALRDQRNILLIGEDSFGKGSVQRLEDLKDGSSLKITIAKWLTPKGNTITDVGLKPDIKVGLTEEDYEQEKDPQLDKAIEIIKEK